VIQPGGNIIVSPGHPETYTLQLTEAPAVGTSVTVNLLSDGQTLVSSTDPRFTAGSGTAAPNAPTVTFDSSNWNQPATITVSVNPSYVPSAGVLSQPVQKFPAQQHYAGNVYGPLVIEGLSIAPRPLVPGVHLPTEVDVALPTPPGAQSDANKVDTLNVFDDGYPAGNTGHLGSISSDEYGVLAPIYSASPNPIQAPAEFGEIDGLNMGVGATFSDGLPAPITFAGGITYHNIDIIDVLLGRGNDTFTVDSTVAGTITVVQGGAGDDHLIANGGGGPGSPLILLGDTTQNGWFYDSTTDLINASYPINLDANPFPVPALMGRQFSHAGNDTIDASTDPNSVTIFGGGGNDTIYGGPVGDWLAGGSGDEKKKKKKKYNKKYN